MLSCNFLKKGVIINFLLVPVLDRDKIRLIRRAQMADNVNGIFYLKSSQSILEGTVIQASLSGIGFVGLKTSPCIAELAYTPVSSCHVFDP